MEDFLKWNPPHQKEIISDGILLPQSGLILHGKFKTFKSIIAMHTGFCLATGTDWFGHKTVPTDTLIIQIEVAEQAQLRRCRKYYHHAALDSPVSKLWIKSDRFLKIDTSWGMSELDKYIAKTGAKVIILDPLYKIMSGDTNDGKDVMRLFDNLDILIDKHKCSFIVIHHERKSYEGEHKGAEQMTGSLFISNWPDGIVGITPTTHEDAEPAGLKLTFEGMRNAERFIPPVKIIISRDNLIPKVVHDVLDPFAQAKPTTINTELIDGEYKPLLPVIDDMEEIEQWLRQSELDL